ncbi:MULTISPECIES: pyridoxal-phosphate-dependent aminotransferase family protein [Corallincola]|uniref:Alanine--glyoxylate aminotransferase family protein n=3 Tax=Corallincola TaxID=1775176 RepID=A0A368NRU5_9GAMM|nr:MULTISPECIES: alanine--glyoxylate aminotransferase family protein [Corallincola]RCU52896.1 alanine--glyoxylate aminotransferase family protein [Corallincola holothuriorum]TAA47950.1 alanine--glyoxylate aminotransferase family protein [Corallincola spongiicola]TCI03392.1 alanine--glyoxylate aminotransferase family protein [Corallincola luteus]
MFVKAPTDIVSLDNILPEEPLLMMGAGPVPIPARVAAANSIVINHLGDTMSQIIEQVKSMSRYVFQTESRHILGVAGPGSAAMEMAVVNLVAPGDTVLSICNGFFSHRLSEMAERTEAKVIRFEVEDGFCADVEQVAQLIAQHKPKVLTIVQGETSNTVYNRHLPAICKLAKAHDCLVITDAVCTLSTMPLAMDEWGVDAVITGGQKGLSSIPGVSLVAFSEQAWSLIESRKDTLRHWCLDARLADQFWYKKSYHYTAPVSGILAMHEALRLICSETLQGRFERHERCSLALQGAIEALGMSLYVEPDSRLNSVVGINVPNGTTGPEILALMSAKHRVEISGSFGPNIIRIGQMGEQCRTHHLFRTVHALGSSVKELGVNVDLPAGVAELEKRLQK